MGIRLPAADKAEVYLKKIKKTARCLLNKGSLKDPSICFGVISVILFLTITFSPTLFLDPLNSEKGVLFFGLGLDENSGIFSQRPFLGQNKSLIATADTPIIIGNSSLLASAPPELISPRVLGTFFSTIDYEPPREQITEYIVQEGETLSGLAERFNISLDTILWANDIKGNNLVPGQKITILPVSGALHLVRPQDTLSEIALWYKADINQIIAFNQIGSGGQIFAGDLLIIPDGQKPDTLPTARLTPLAGSYFICPLGSPCRVSYGLHHYNAVDLSNGQCGEPVLAAAGGRVQRTGYHSLGGNFVLLLHPNGVATYYGHFSRVVVAAGQQVSQGQTIGYTGKTGLATGCHVHFEVRGAANPFVR